jgi:hypothetical protein
MLKNIPTQQKIPTKIEKIQWAATAVGYLGMHLRPYFSVRIP